MPGTASSKVATIASVSGPALARSRKCATPSAMPKARNATCAIASVVASAATEAAA